MPAQCAGDGAAKPQARNTRRRCMLIPATRTALPLLAALTACASAGMVTVPPVAPLRQAYVVVARDTGLLWRATWHLEKPVRELRFTRPSRFRAEAFDVLTPGFEIGVDARGEVLRTDGAPVQEISVRFPEHDRPFEKDYEFFRRFTDGSVAIFTGHLLATTDTAGGSCTACEVRAFRIVPPAGAHVVVGGVVTRDTSRWSDSTGSGTYAYIGAIEPVEAAGVVAVVDPGLPEWVDVRWRVLLPEIFSRYRERLGEPRAGRTTVLFDYRPTGATGHDYGGGVLPGVIQLGIRGSAWEAESHDALVRITRFLAHEASHVWNAGLAEPTATAAPWMHEGAADALAERMLLELGLIDERQLLATQTAALNDCRNGTRGRSARVAGRRDARLIYACGHILALLTESSLRPGEDLFSFWRTLIAGAAADAGGYDERHYFAAARSLGAPASALASLAQLADSGAHADTIVAALARAGVRIATRSNPPPQYLKTLGFEALLALQQSDCGGRASVQRVPLGLLVGTSLRCANFPAGATITHIGGRDVVGTPHLVWSYLTGRCGSAQPVVMAVVGAGQDGESRDVSIPCPVAVVDRPAYVEILGSGDVGPRR